MSISYFWSRSFLMNRYFLWLLFIFNFVGTIYGYIWYDGQMAYTLENYAAWLIVFVPDSPTASLFFSIAIWGLLFPPKMKMGRMVLHLVEALAVITSVKYGLWASGIIFAGVAEGNTMVWQDWMLVGSHTAMAVEALLYVRFFSLRAGTLIGAAAWTLLNDTVDYTYGVFPWLPTELEDHIGAVRNFTVGLTCFSVAVSWLTLKLSRRH
ncbi:DUF1405 domain-containing protein [Paenibacillus sp. IHBB 10380]|uniref:DUF1405 domain-containing protein n=1 Tax=Paenibacillus sp. IHBB 10380 TaxID=1566358 RepID=UPI0005CFCEC6|nr:DUF1405 domain-containing protein [Paenibacillus sp. IHBB 10380]AJS58062.1 hypothetical protein UB51_05610 [Paenibacillus sp. IHBB 10380]